MSEVSKRHGLSVRGDSLYCPLCFSVEPYRWCSPDCPSCFFRGLNRIWGSPVSPVNIPLFKMKLEAGLRNKNPQTPLAHCLANKKTMRIGNKVDAFNPLENKYHVSKKIIRVLLAKEWSFVVQTRFPYTLWNFTTFDWDRFRKFGTVLVVITPGRDLDWEIMEGKKTHTTLFRLEALKNFQEVGVPVGVQGEPYIPGFHTPSMFEETLKLLKSYGVKSYTTYNFHFTPFVAKRLAELRDPRVDVEKIWYYNQDKEWRKILRELLDIAKRLGIRMGCPDFVNSGRKHVEPFNTCCGINVSNPCTFNTHYFKRFAQQGMSLDRILSLTNDGTGNYENALSILNGNTESEFYTLRDAGVLPKGVK